MQDQRCESARGSDIGHTASPQARSCRMASHSMARAHTWQGHTHGKVITWQGHVTQQGHTHDKVTRSEGMARSQADHADHTTRTGRSPVLCPFPVRTSPFLSKETTLGMLPMAACTKDKAHGSGRRGGGLATAGSGWGRGPRHPSQWPGGGALVTAGSGWVGSPRHLSQRGKGSMTEHDKTGTLVSH